MKNSMRRFAAVLALVGVLGTMTACGNSNSDSSGAPDNTENQIRIGMECAYAPNNWQEDDATDSNLEIENLPGFYAEGYDVQIARHIATSMGKEPVIVKLAWGGLIEALNNGQIDMIIAGMADTAERREAINFSEPYHRTEYCIMVKNDSVYAGATSIDEFQDASILGQKDTMYDTVIDQMDGVNHLPAVDSVPNMITRLDQDTADGLVFSLGTAETYANVYPDFKIIRFEDGKGFDLGFVGSCVGLRMSEEQMLTDVNAALAAISEETRAELWETAVATQPQ